MANEKCGRFTCQEHIASYALQRLLARNTNLGAKLQTLQQDDRIVVQQLTERVCHNLRLHRHVLAGAAFFHQPETIIQIGSVLSYRSIPLQSAYCACKHAINGFTDSLRCELHHDNSNVKVTAILMPAMNTTQFDWAKNRMPNDTQPVPPIYEPELAAKVVVAAGLAKYPRREYWVGTPTVAAIIGQKFIPGLLDIYLGMSRYKSQQIPNERGLGRPEQPL